MELLILFHCAFCIFYLFVFKWKSRTTISIFLALLKELLPSLISKSLSISASNPKNGELKNKKWCE